MSDKKTLSISFSDKEWEIIQKTAKRRGLSSEAALIKRALRLQQRIEVAMEDDDQILIGTPLPPKSLHHSEAFRKLAEFADKEGFPEVVLTLQKQLGFRARLESISSWPVKGKQNETRCGDYLFFTVDDGFEVYCEKEGQPWLVFSHGYSAITALMEMARKTEGGHVLQEEIEKDGSYHLEYSHPYLDDLNLHYQPDEESDRFRIFASNVTWTPEGDKIVSEFIDWRWSGLGSFASDFASPEQALEALKDFMEND